MATRRTRAKVYQTGKNGVWLTLLAFVLAVIFIVGALQGKVRGTEITVYKSPTCGCCKKWVDHLEDNGFSVDAVNLSDLSSLKDEHGIPEKAYACHTAIVDGYVVEGHVPAGDIKRMLTERPSIRGLAVPGMPAGSPGMEERYSDPYDVLALSDGGSMSVFSEH
jgi:hypothetical protein